MTTATTAQRTPRRGFLLLAAVLGAASCAPTEPRPTATGPSVVVIAVDTLRADTLSCYGGKPDLTPAIDDLASRGVRFTRARSHAPWTLPSFASLFTSLPPNIHGAGGNMTGFRPLQGDAPTLAEIFRDAGYETGAFVNVDFLSPEFGMARGFDHHDLLFYEENRRVRRADAVTDSALEWLQKERSRPYFLLVHYFDPHAVYDPPTEARRAHADRRDRFDESFVFGTRQQVVGFHMGVFTPDQDTLDRARNLYEGEVAHVDRQVRRLLAGLPEPEETIILFTSDHGEEFGDHGGFEHGHTHYEELLHVPLILVAPAQIEARVVERPVSLIDVAPTLCRLAGVDIPAGFMGSDLLEPPTAARPHLAYGNFWGDPLISWEIDSLKLIGFPDGRLELYDLSKDPGEQVDLSSEQGTHVETMRAALVSARLVGETSPEVLDLSERTLERLEELGYAGDAGTDEDE